MANFKSNPVFFTTLGVIGLMAIGTGWAISNRYSAAHKNAAQLARKNSELAATAMVTPSPSDANKLAIESDLRRTEVALSKMRQELKGGAVAEAFRKVPVPTTSTNAFFNLETFVQSTRQKYLAAGVTVRPDERFGFATYQSAGPQPELIARVFLQRQVAEYLLGTLLAAKPNELVSFQRERLLTKAEQDAGASATAQVTKNTNPDFFEIDSRISARVPGFVNATAFRFSFISDTAALRAVLNQLATFELPLVVRSVEVEPTAGRARQASAAPTVSLDSLLGGTTDKASAPAPDQIKPLVETLPSKFTVTVELIDFVEAPSTEATPNS